MPLIHHHRVGKDAAFTYGLPQGMEQQCVNQCVPLSQLFPTRLIRFSYSVADVLDELLQLLERVFDKAILNRIAGVSNGPYR